MGEKAVGRHFPFKFMPKLWSFPAPTPHNPAAFLSKRAPMDEVPGVQANRTAQPAGPRCGPPASWLTWPVPAHVGGRALLWMCLLLPDCGALSSGPFCPRRWGPSCQVSGTLAFGSEWCPGSSEAVSEQLVLPGTPKLSPPVSPPSRLHTNYCSCPSLHPGSLERILSYSPLPPHLRVPGSQVRGLLKSPSAGEEVTARELRQSSHTAGTNLKYAC